MAQTMYSNPTALRPEFNWKPENALAGHFFNQNAQDYRQRFDQQTRLQDLGEQEQRYDFAEKQAGGPLRDLERQLKGETIQGQLPLARQFAESGMRLGLAKNDFDMKTEFGPEALRAKVAKYLGDADDIKFKKFMQENQYAASLLEQAMSIEQARGPVAAIEYVDQRARELEQQGFKFPEHFKNPMNWKPMYDAAVNSVKMAQELKQIRAKGDEEVRGRRVSGEYTVEAARVGANARVEAAKSAATKPPNMNNTTAALNYLEREIAQARESGDPETIMRFAPQYEAALGRKYDEEIKKMRELGIISGQVDDKVKVGRDKYIMDGMGLQGFRLRGGGTPPPPAPASGGQGSAPKADPLGLR